MATQRIWSRNAELSREDVAQHGETTDIPRSRKRTWGSRRSPPNPLAAVREVDLGDAGKQFESLLPPERLPGRWIQKAQQLVEPIGRAR